MSYRDQLAQAHKISTLLCFAMIGMMGGFLFLGNAINNLPEKWTMDTSPDLNMAYTRNLGDRDKTQIHGYAWMMHMSLNSWYELDKKFDASRYRDDVESLNKQQPISLLRDFRCYMTPEFRYELETRTRNTMSLGQYFGQERVVKLIPGKAFADVNVYSLGNSWVVDLPVRQSEYWKGKKLYERDISVKYRVVGGDSRSVNCSGTSWNFQLAGFYEEPKEMVIKGDSNG
ncbi:DUF2895 family protein [Vibrio lentus]|uniref:DUF2895 family protein n=1 Tax=Vibrio splendidus TaxID=29497 RepID=UPI000C8601D0|nr:DUF2895 family protein [Vibrio splendidus]PMG17926.1 hypothetical protein BCU98_00910 [Vibrio splendidus]